MSTILILIIILLMLPPSSALYSSRLLLLPRHCIRRSGGHRRNNRSNRDVWSVEGNPGRQSATSRRCFQSVAAKKFRPATTTTRGLPIVSYSSIRISSKKTALFSSMSSSSSSSAASEEKKLKIHYSGNKRTMDHDDDNDDDSADGGEDIDIDNELLQEVDTNDAGENNKSSPYRNEYQDIYSKFTALGQNLTSIDDLPRGIPDGFYIIQYSTIPDDGFTQSQLESAFTLNDITRLQLTPRNVTVPVALLLLFPNQFATRTRATKEVRKRKVLVHRGPLLLDRNEAGVDEDGGNTNNDEGSTTEKQTTTTTTTSGGLIFDNDKLEVAKADYRIGTGDTIAIQTRMTHNYAECRVHDKTPPFILPVIYEDDHFAIVNKPEGIVVFSHKGGGFGRESVKACLPWALSPPTAGVMSVMRRPCPVHRIDRGTSGLLVCAKTKPAMIELARMFKERKVKKTYTAIVNGDILEPSETSITSNEAQSQGVCIGNEEETSSWQIIDKELDDQLATTIWRTIRKMKLENARNDTISLVELKPKTGRYHQLRRHMAWVANCPLLGDKLYDGGGLAKTLRDEGFYLCSNRVTLEHPFYNSPQGKSEWKAKRRDVLGVKKREDGGSSVHITEDEDGSVWVHCHIELPLKFLEIEARLTNSKVNTECTLLADNLSKINGY